MNLDELLAAGPLLHVDGAGTPTSYALAEPALRIIEARVRPGWRTLETGEGMSTVLLALKGAHHTCVTLNAGAVRRIRDFCAARGIRLDDVRFEIGGSQDVLPHLSSEPLDLVLIDGGHGFPVPFVDWLYTAGRLRLGGLLIVDDIQLWTGHVLKQFLEEEPEWRLVEEHPRRTAVFIREREGEVAKEWCFQPYVLHHDPYPDRRGTVGRGLRMLARGDLRTFGRRLTELGRRR